MNVTEHTYAARVSVGTFWATLRVKGGNINFDVSRWPLVEGTLRVAIDDYATLRDLDPRLPRRVIITASEATAGRVRQFDLALRRIEPDRDSGEAVLSLASDEALLEDYGPLAADEGPRAYQASLRGLVNYVLRKIGAHLEPGGDDENVSANPPIGAEPEVFTWGPGVGGVSFLAPILRTYGRRLVCDEQRRWTLRDTEYWRPGVVEFVEGTDGIITVSEETSREADDWYDGLVLSYRWIDANGDRHERIDAYSATSNPTKVVRQELGTPWPGAGRAQYAVAAARRRGRLVSLEAVTDWDVHPEQKVRLQMTGVPLQQGYIRSLEFDLDTDRMRLIPSLVDTRTGAIDLLDGVIDALVGNIDDL